MVYVMGVYEAILKGNVKDWKEQIEVVNASPRFQALRREIDSTQRSIEKLIEENNLDALLTKLPKTVN